VEAVLSALSLLVVVAVAQRARADRFTPVVGSIVGSKTVPVPGSDGRTHVVYEVLLTNASTSPASLEALDVLRADDGSKPIVSLSGETLLPHLHELDIRRSAGGTIPPSEGRMLYVNLHFDEHDDVPAQLVHRVELRAAAVPGAREPTSLRYTVAPVTLDRRPLPVLRPPLAGAGWVALNGCCGAGGTHRGAVMPVNGRLWDAQRFAIDWMRLDDQGRLVAGDPSTPASWIGYGAPILAAGDATVVRARDGLEDQMPGKLPEPGSIDAETVDGNHVVVDHGGGIHTFYAHLQPGTLAVEAGQRVDAGQELGRVGNTGNTTAPHLHFHAMTGPSPLGSDGIPYMLERFTVTDRLRDAGVELLLAGARVAPPAASRPVPVERALPLDRSVVDFGEPR